MTRRRFSLKDRSWNTERLFLFFLATTGSTDSNPFTLSSACCQPVFCKPSYTYCILICFYTVKLLKNNNNNHRGEGLKKLVMEAPRLANITQNAPIHRNPVTDISWVHGKYTVRYTAVRTDFTLPAPSPSPLFTSLSPVNKERVAAETRPFACASLLQHRATSLTSSSRTVTPSSLTLPPSASPLQP